MSDCIPPTIPRDVVAVSVYPPEELPTSTCPYDGAEVNPVPPYNTPTDVVAETTPLFACSGPLGEPARVSAPALLNDDVAVPPKYAEYPDNNVEEAFPLILTFPPKKEFPATSKIFPFPAVVEVLFAPITKMLEVSVG